MGLQLEVLVGWCLREILLAAPSATQVPRDRQDTMSCTLSFSVTITAATSGSLPVALPQTMSLTGSVTQLPQASNTVSVATPQSISLTGRVSRYHQCFLHL